MAKQIGREQPENPKWDVKPGSPEFRLAKVDGRATVDVGGRGNRWGNRLGPSFRGELWGGRSWIEMHGSGIVLPANERGKIENTTRRGEAFVCNVRRGGSRGRWERHILSPDGSVEWEIEWASLADVPTEQGYVDFELDFSGDLTWHRQDKLTQAEIDEGCERPIEVVNSYAVYTNRANNGPDGNFETGKFAHLYRSWLEDEDGNRHWLDQTAPLAGPNRLRVYLDAAAIEWFGGARFPVRLGPTLGYTTAGGTEQLLNTNVLACGPWTLGTAGTATGISVYLQNRTTSTRRSVLGIYDHDSGPKNRKANGESADVASGSAAGWLTIAVNVELAAADYYLGWHTSGAWRSFYDNLSPTTGYVEPGIPYDASGPPDPFPSSPTSTADRRYSAYFTYTAAATGNPWYYYANQ